MAAEAGKSRIFIVDDHPMVREGLAYRISSQDDLEVCGEAATATEALAGIRETGPDLVIVDIVLKEGHGLDLIKQIATRFPGTRTLVHSMHDEVLYAERCLKAGALGYVDKQADREKVLEAIRQVLDGRVYLSAAMTERVLHRSMRARGSPPATPLEALSNRELEVFDLLGQGLSPRQIAGRLHLSIKTIETHRENIKAKLHLKTSAELTRFAVHWALDSK